MREQPSLRIVLLSLASLTALAGFSVGQAWLDAAQGQPAREARPQQAQPPRDPNTPGAQVPAGKGSISGTVVVAGTGQPARRARVNLTGGNDVGGARSTSTDDAGRFAFTALPEGRFNLSASKPGHITGTYGQRQPGRPGTPIQLSDGQRLQVQLQITRGGVITGTVLDENAEALPGTPVRALRYVMQSGQRTLQSAGSGQTDDRGVYRIYGLQPGEYIVFATPRNNNPGPDMARQAELQQLLDRSEVMARLEAAQAQAPALAERVAELRATMQASNVATGDETVSGYAPVYYPGTTAPSSAATVTVGPGEEKASIDFQYQIVPIARVDGVVVTTATPAPTNIQISLVNTAFAVPGITPGSARADAQGAFRIPNVPPGQYTLVARAAIGGTGREGFPGREGGPGGRGLIPGGRGELLAGRGRGLVPPASDAIRLVGNGGRNGQRSQRIGRRADAAAGDVGVGSSRVRGHDPAAANRFDAASSHACPRAHARHAGRDRHRSGRACRCRRALHDRERRPGSIPADRVGRGQWLVPRVVNGRGSRLAGLSDRGQAQPEYQQRGRDVCRSPVGAERHHRQRACSAGSRVQPHRLSR